MSLRPKTRRRMTIVAVVGLTIVLLLTGLVAWRRSQVKVDAAAMRAQGVAAYEQEDWDKALQSLSSYIGRVNDDAEAHYYFADVRRRIPMRGGKHIIESIAHLRRGLAIDPGHVASQDLLLELLPIARMHTETLELTDRLLTRDPDHVKALKARARALAGLRRFEDAQAAVERLTALQPDDIEARMLELQLMRALGADDQAIIGHAEQLRRNKPDDPTFKLVQAQGHMITGQRDQVTRWVESAARDKPTDPAVVSVLANFADTVGQFDLSLEALRRLTDQDGESGIRSRLARRLWELRRPAEALDYLPDENPAEQNADVLAVHALALIDAGRTDEAAPIVAELRKRAEQLEAEPLGDDEIDHAPDLWLMLIENWEAGVDAPAPQLVELGRRGRVRQPGNPYFRHALARGYASVGEGELAIKGWTEAIRMRRSWVVPYLELSRQLLNRGAAGEALALVRIATDASPDWLEAKLLELAARAATAAANPNDSPEQLLADVEAVIEQHPDEMLPRAIQAQVLVLLERKDAAAEAVRSAIEQTEAEDVLLRLASVSARHDLGVEQACLERIERLHGVTPSLALQRSMRQLGGQDKTFDETLAQFDRMRADAEHPGRLEWLLARARLLEAAGDDRAADAWAALLEQHPDNVRAAKAVIESNVAWNDRDLVDRAIQQVRQASGDDGIAWRLARARWILNGEPDDAELAACNTMLNDLAGEIPNSPEPHLLLAQCLVMLDQPIAARGELELAANLSPNRPSIRLDLARLQLRTGDRNAAVATLGALAANADQLNPAQRSTVVAMLSQLGEADHVIGLLGGLEPQQMLPAEQALLAQTYMRQDRLDEAEPIVRRLLERSVDPLSVQMSAELLARRGKLDEAQQALDRLDETEAEEGLKQLLRAEFAQRFGSAEAGYAHLQEAARQSPDSPLVWRQLVSFEIRTGRFEEAIAHAGQAVDALETAPRGLSVLVAQAETIGKFAGDPVMRGVIAAMVEAADNVEPAMALLDLLDQADAERRSFESVGADLLAYIDQYPGFLPGQLAVAEYLARFGRVGDAASVAMRATEAFPASAQPAQVAARLLAAAGRADEAIGVARQWRARQPSNPFPADLFIAELQLGLNQPRQTLDRLVPYAERIDAAPEAHAAAVTVRAAAQARLGRYERVEQTFTPLLEVNGRWASVWLNLTMRHVADREVMARWLAAIEAKAPADDRQTRLTLSEAFYALGQQTARLDLVDKADAMLDRIAADFPQDAGVALTGAIRHERAGRNAEAEAAYRRTLELDANQPIAANNLAMVYVNRGENLDEAVRLIESAIEQQPTVAAYHDTAALAEAARGNFDAAVQHLREAVKLQPQSLEWQVNLADVLVQADQTEQARDLIEQLQTVDVTNPRIPERLRNKLATLRESLTQGQPADN